MSPPPFDPVPVKPRHDGWTPARQRRFVEALAVTGSITRAAALVGMSARSAQKLRRHPQAAAFCAAWDAALAQSFAEAETMAIDRALQGEVVMIERADGRFDTLRRPCSARVLVRLLDRHENAQARALQMDRIANFGNFG